MSKEFFQLALSIGVITKSVPVEAHWSIGIVERYYAMLQRAYKIIDAEMPKLTNDIALQIAVKAINDTAGLDGLVPTLLVFGAYSRITNYNLSALTMTQRTAVFKKIMTKL
jgi:hypothetical protein